MPKTRRDIREGVLDRVRTATLDRMCDYVKRKKPTLRGNEGEEYLTACVLVALCVLYSTSEGHQRMDAGIIKDASAQCTQGATPPGKVGKKECQDGFIRRMGGSDEVPQAAL